VLSGRGLCDELIARPEDSYRLCCVVVCDLETSGICTSYIYDISHLRVNSGTSIPGINRTGNVMQSSLFRCVSINTFSDVLKPCLDTGGRHFENPV
jgi:hypothetical protein